MDMITLHLRLALKKPGCPLCRLQQDTARRYITGLLHENVNDVTTRTHLAHSLGLCPEHAWQLEAIELDNWHNGLGTTIIYNDLTARVLDAANRFSARYHQPDPPAVTRSEKIRRRLQSWGIAGRWLAELLPRPRPGHALLTALSPREPCRVCETVNRSNETYVLWLSKALTDPDFQALYTASDGICLPHLRQFLATAKSPAAVDFLVEDTRRRLAQMHHRLSEYDRKQKWENHTETVLPQEEAAWARVIAFFAGEASPAPSARVQKARTDALRLNRRQKETDAPSVTAHPQNGVSQ